MVLIIDDLGVWVLGRLIGVLGGSRTVDAFDAVDARCATSSTSASQGT